MRVGVSAYLMHEGRDYRAAGVSVYTEQLVRHLIAEARGHEYVVFAGPDAPPVDGARFVRAPLPTWKPAVRVAWEQFGLPVQAGPLRLDVLHATVNVLPILSRTPAVVTVHDLSFLRHPERFRMVKVRYLREAVRVSVARARAVIAVSASTKGDLVELLGVRPDLVHVVHPGVQPMFRPLSADERIQARASLGQGRPFILHVGTLEPRKNIDVLIEAYAAARVAARLPHQLVLAGAHGWMYEDLFALVQRLRLEEHVRFVGYVAPLDLPLWYNLADLFVYPSAYEGFGLPLLEAMACGTPCVTSSGSSLGEVAGDACVLVEPGSREDLRVALVRVLEDAGLRQDLAERGRLRALEFSWSATARRTSDVYDVVIEG